jgi:hypothetical protein
MPWPPEEMYRMYHQILVNGAVKEIGFEDGTSDVLT